MAAIIQLLSSALNDLYVQEPLLREACEPYMPVSENHRILLANPSFGS